MMLSILSIVVLIALSSVSFGNYIHISDYTNHPCIRTCDNNATMTCEYNFTVEYYYTMSKACRNCPYNITDCSLPHCVAADGNPRGIITVNRMLPGPAIHVCEGDVIVVNVYNNLENGEGLSIHWHGIHQNDYQYMDGVAMITQCPINAFTSFQYRFRPSNPGTHFWHAHTGYLRADGIHGALVVRQASKKEAHISLYDEDKPEHALLISNWMIDFSINRYSENHFGGDSRRTTYLLNGKGFAKTFPVNGTITHTPYEKITVKRARSYRMRIIGNGVFGCPIQLSIDNHSLLIIASDGNPVKPMEVESVVVFAGERYDFVLYASSDIGNYWIRLRASPGCDGMKHTHQQGILHYESAPDSEPAGPTAYKYSKVNGKILNPWNKKQTSHLIQVSSLESLLPDDEALKRTPDKRFYLAMDFVEVQKYHFRDPTYYPMGFSMERDNVLYSPQINHISVVLPPAPLLSQFDDVPQEMICNAETVRKNCTKEICECAHTLQIDLGDVVEFIYLDEGTGKTESHPMHLHGYSFRVLGMDKLNDSTTLEEIKALDAAGKLHRNFNKSVSKDTVAVADGGYVILRIHATNPGFWFFHCHIDAHLGMGMGLVLHVGNKTQIPKPPYKFPKCGSWAPSVPQEDQENMNDQIKCHETSNNKH